LVFVTETLGLRERKKLGTRWALSDAALELALERGLENVTREDIANRAGVSLRTFSNYFAGEYGAVAFRQVVGGGRASEPSASGRRRAAVVGDHQPVLEPLEMRGPRTCGRPRRAGRDRDCFPRDMRAALTKHLFADWVAAIAQRTGADPVRDMYPRLVAAVVRTVGETAMEAYAYAEPPVAYTELLRRGFADVAAGLPER
jgi:AcrR family transcriptional regulator